jgi:trans-aconitate 2-methyltransferase
LAERCGLHVRRIHTQDKTWDFGSREAFVAFGSVTFVEWTQFIQSSDTLAFINDVLDRYRMIGADRPAEENCFRFYQMDVTLSPIERS